MLKKYSNTSTIGDLRSITILILFVLIAVTIVFGFFSRVTLPSSLIVSTLTFSGIFVSITYLAILEAAKSHLIKELPLLIRSNDKSEAFLLLSRIPFLVLLLGIIFFISGSQILFELLSFDLFILASIFSFFIFLEIIQAFLYRK